MPLEFVPTEDLWKELQNRFNACILITEESEKIGRQTITNMICKGSWCHILGLMEDAKDTIIQIKKVINESTPE